MAPPSEPAKCPGPLVTLLTNWQPCTVTRAPSWISRAPPETVAELLENVQLLNCTADAPETLSAPPPVGVLAAFARKVQAEKVTLALLMVTPPAVPGEPLRPL